ncbi:MAG: hypothetical protein AAGF11_26210 [Myxococcota bacterium]
MFGCQVEAEPFAAESEGSADTDAYTDDADRGIPASAAQGPCQGYATRFWDCCKPHCSWSGNVDPAMEPLGTCNQANAPQGDPNIVSSCSQLGAGSAYACYSLTPWAVNDNLAYGFAAVPAAGDSCGRCYSLEFTGSSHNGGADPGSAALAGKTMVVQAINIGHDVNGGQFDIMIPGGGVGLFDACSHQWGVDTSELGATYGGLLTACQNETGGSYEAAKSCVVNRCNELFAGGQFSDLAAGCQWFIDWYEAADNPSLTYTEVECPAELIGATGMDRSPLGDTLSCGGGGGGGGGDGGGGGGDGGGAGDCDCSWTNGGANCGWDDGSVCWSACCGDGGGPGGDGGGDGGGPGDGGGGGVECPGGCDCGWTNGGANCGGDDGSCCWSACCG